MVEISLELNCSDFDALARFVDDKPLALSLAVNGALSCSRSSSAGRSKRLALGLTLNTRPTDLHTLNNNSVHCNISRSSKTPTPGPGILQSLPFLQMNNLLLSLRSS